MSGRSGAVKRPAPPACRQAGVPRARRIILVGFMGAGKSFCGRMLARRLGVPHFDSDREIRKAERMTIPGIFRRKGGRYFRDAELRALKKIFRRNAFVVSTGGGAVVRAAGRRLIRKSGFVIWVRAPRAAIERRTRGKSHRPLLNTGDRAARIASLLREREPRYRECADAVLQNDGSPLGPKCDRLLRRVHLK